MRTSAEDDSRVEVVMLDHGGRFEVRLWGVALACTLAKYYDSVWGALNNIGVLDDRTTTKWSLLLFWIFAADAPIHFTYRAHETRQSATDGRYEPGFEYMGFTLTIGGFRVT
ncbi:MAG: hypothetical protein VXX04_05685, partial [Actinomycetota bacterium]|nr:hypothetical protein [Actinomycetota bacterium]